MGEKSLAPLGTIQTRGPADVNFREYILVVVKRRWLIAAVLALVVLATVIYNLRQTPLYRSVSTIYIDRLTYSFVPQVVAQDFSYQGYEAFFETQYKLLQSFGLAGRVQRKLNLTAQDLAPPDQRAGMRRPAAMTEEARDQIADRLLGMVQVLPVKNTTLCQVSFATPDPKLSQLLANTWADQYVELTIASQYDDVQKASGLLADQVKQLQKEIDQKQKLLQDYSLRKQVVRLDSERSIGSRTLEDLNDALTAATQRRISTEVHYRDMKSQKVEAIPEVRNHPVVMRLNEEHSTLSHQFSEKSAIFQPEYPELVNLKTQISENRSRLNRTMTQVYEQVLSTAKAQFEEAARNEAALKQELEKTKRETIEVGKEEFDYDRLKLELNDKKRFLEGLLQKQSETDISAQAKEQKATTIRVVERARLPKGIFKPNIPYNITLSVLFGLILGISLAFASEYFDRSIKNVDEVERYVNLPFLGVVPRYDGESNGNGHESKALRKRQHSPATVREAIDLVTLYNPSSVTAEAFKTIRTSLLLSFPEAPPRTIVVTSSRAGEGKTFIASNLAFSLAQLDKKVILIDADMRNPRLHRVWGLPNNAGLSNLLTSDIDLNDVVRPAKGQSMSVITSGQKTPRPAELISSQRFDELLQMLQASYDHVIVDAPPVMPVSDSLILSTKCACVLFVIHGGVTPRDVVQMAKQKLQQIDAVIAGAVLNCINLNDPYYYYSYYSNYSYRYDDSHHST